MVFTGTLLDYVPGVAKFTNEITGDKTEEKPTETTTEETKIEEKPKGIEYYISWLFSLIAFYLSWSYNTSKGETLPLKIFYGLVASMFGWIYLVYAFIFNNAYVMSLAKQGSKSTTTTMAAAFGFGRRRRGSKRY